MAPSYLMKSKIPARLQKVVILSEAKDLAVRRALSAGTARFFAPNHGGSE
jgi:hypothetical protein